MNEIIKEWGAPGVIIIALATYYAIKDKAHQRQIDRLDELHRIERDKQQQTTERQFDKMNESSNATTNVLSAIKTILENRK